MAICTDSSSAPRPTAIQPDYAASPCGRKKCSSSTPATRFANPHTTFTTGDDSPCPGGFANGDGNGLPLIPCTK